MECRGDLQTLERVLNKDGDINGRQDRVSTVHSRFTLSVRFILGTRDFYLFVLMKWIDRLLFVEKHHTKSLQFITS